MKKAFVVFTLVVFQFAISQEYYLVSVVDFPILNTLHQMNLTDCNDNPLATCTPTNNAEQAFEQIYSDIAVNAAGDIFYVTAWGSLYRQNLLGECVFLGTFDHVVNALTCDSGSKLYAAGSQNSVTKLFGYDTTTGIFSTIGDMPDGFFPSGDLFFYENSLLMTATNSDFTASSLTEINMTSPGESCVIMELGNLQPFGAFSIFDNAQTQSYITTAENGIYTLRQIDIVNQTVGPVICTYDFQVLGAAAYYQQSSVTSSCLLGISSHPVNGYVNVISPAQGQIQIETNIEIMSCRLYDVSGRKVKSFAATDLDISDVASGVYLFELTSVNGKKTTRKIIIE